jgi:ketosteroid isomerase-like protein
MEVPMDISGTQTERLLKAINKHDLDEFAETFAIEYQSQQPAHPSRAFTGRETARSHWSNFFTLVPDFQAEVLRFASHGNTEWAEWRWHGTQTNGTAFEVRGVIILGAQNGSVAWGRLYMEPVETQSHDHYGELADTR